MNINTIVKHYLIAAIWSECVEGTNPRLSKQAVDSATAFVTDFIQKNAEIVALVLKNHSYGWHNGMCSSDAAFGHDLWLTGKHGVGFWDRGLGELGQRITAVCTHHQCAEFSRGWLYLSN